MNVQIQFLRQPDALRNVLREDGWRFTNNCMSHSQAMMKVPLDFDSTGCGY